VDKPKNKTILVILQNAYGVEDGYIPDYSRESFARSFTGKRLRDMLPTAANNNIRNSSPKVGKLSSAWFAPDYEYIAGELEQLEYDAVLACGTNAVKVVNHAISLALDFPVPLVCAPHPAWRRLSKAQCKIIRDLLQDILYGPA
jgi:hypothetical protein